MRLFAKRLLIITGIAFISFPFLARGAEYLAEHELLTTTHAPLTNQPLADSPRSPFPPSTYVARVRGLLDQAETSDNPSATRQTALEIANEGLHFHPDSAELHHARGDGYAALTGVVTDARLLALHAYTTSYTLRPNQDVGKQAVAFAQASGNYEQAVELLTQLHAADPDNPTILLDLAQTQAKAGLLEEAIASYTTVIQLLPRTDSTAVVAERDTLVRLVAATLPPAETSDEPEQSIAIGGINTTDDNENEQSTSETISNSNETVQTLQVGGQAPGKDLDQGARSGEAVIAAGATSVTIANSLVTPESQIYLTPTDSMLAIPIYMSEKKNGGFTVSVNHAITNDITVKWWIKNV